MKRAHLFQGFPAQVAANRQKLAVSNTTETNEMERKLQEAGEGNTFGFRLFLLDSERLKEQKHILETAGSFRIACCLPNF